MSVQNCPACGRQIRSDAGTCPHCYTPLRASVTPWATPRQLSPDEAQAIVERYRTQRRKEPLAGLPRKAQQAARVMPIIAVSVVVLMHQLLHGGSTRPSTLIINGLILLYVLYITLPLAIGAHRDLRRSYVQVDVAYLTRVVARRKTLLSSVSYADFATLGELRMAGPVERRGLVPGAIYRITYSPDSRMLWAAEPLDEPAPPTAA